MGISGLLPLLKEIQVNGHISEFKGKRLAVDAYVWLHKGAFGCAEDLVKGKKTTKFVDYAMHRVRLLRYHGITPFVVFDGGPLPAKKGTEVSRAKSRAENLERARSMESQGRWREARDFYTRCLDITPEMAYQLIKALRAENVDYVVAPYEADAQLCFLEREGYVDGIITEDSDLLVFGCRQVVFKLDGNGQCVWIHRDNLATIRDFPMHGWTDTQFRRMAMLSGCDYLDSIPGIGLKTAHRLLRRFNTVEKLLQHVRMEGTLVIPPNYLSDFAQAELAFIHQRVYHPHQRRLVPLNDFPEGGLAADDEKWIGLDVEEAVARGMALGDLHPETRLQIVDEWPDFQPVARAKPLGESSRSNLPSGRGPMDAFVIKGMTKSKSLPTPVGKLSSGPSRLSDLQPTQSAPPDLLLNRPSSAPVKRSKFFSGSSRVKREATPEVEPELEWGESQGADIESQPIAGPSRIRSTSPQTIRSPSPDVCSVRDDSPVRSLVSEGHFVSSPGGPALSSPTCSTPGIGIPFSTPRRKDGRVREDTPPSPTGATAGGGSSRRVLIAASSGAWETDEISSIKVESQIPTPAVTSSAKKVKVSKESENTTRLRTSVTSSFTVRAGRVPETQHPATRVALNRHKQLSSSSATSTDTVEDQEELVTPSFGSVTHKKRKRSHAAKAEPNVYEAEEDQIENHDDEEEEEEEQEVKSREKAKTIGQGWREKYALGQSSSSPAPIDNTPRRTPTMNKRTKSDPTPRTRNEASSTSSSSRGNDTVTPRALPLSKRPLMPLTATAPKEHVLASRRINVPFPTSMPAKRSTSGQSFGRRFSIAEQENATPLLGRSKAVTGDSIVPASSSPISRSSSNEDGSGDGDAGGGFSPLGTQPGGKTWSKLQKYRMGS
ncbi:hypothetical protein IAU59_005567 [Kwoniella sp. CBS 9459]